MSGQGLKGGRGEGKLCGGQGGGAGRALTGGGEVGKPGVGSREA